MDTYRKPVRYAVAEVAAYVTYFAQLIAGPIVRHSEIIPQFRESRPAGLYLLRFLVGLVFFWVGYAKKIYLADNLAVYANWGFARAAEASTGAHETWLALLSYTLQLYFDFSGYADMAIGLGLMFGFVLPINFNSPYRAASPTDFWRRWHMTLSTFLRDYLFLPISYWLSRRIDATHWMAIRVEEWIYAGAILVTMTLGGLWHGAAWTFVVWGAYHGAWLVVSHVWRRKRRRARWAWLSVPVTFLLTTVGWVFFRAPDLATAIRMLGSMAVAPRWTDVADTLTAWWRSAVEIDPRILSPYWDAGDDATRAGAFVLIGLAIVFCLPNLNGLLTRVDRVPTLLTRPAVVYATVAALCVIGPVLFGVVPVLADLYANALAPAQFIYFNF